MEKIAIVATPDQAVSNILRFRGEVDRSPDLQARLAYARAWYAHQDENGQWHFGPSKFIGYDALSAEAYIDTAEDRDGRRTEAQLKKWFCETQGEQEQTLGQELYAFLAKYGKTPSTKVRISVQVRSSGPASRLSQLKYGPDGDPQDQVQDQVVDLIVAVAKTLRPSQLERLRAELDW